MMHLSNRQETYKRTFLNSEVSPSGCREWKGHLSNKGYAKIREAGGGKMLACHRLSYEAYWGPIPDGMLVMHKCDNRKCIEPNHLVLGTNDQNIMDMVKKGRSSRGLTCEQALEIRRLGAEGVKQKDIALLMGCAPNTVSRIINRVRRPIIAGE
jgi:hypothetical protein